MNVMTDEQALKVLEMFLHKQCSLERTKFAYDENTVWTAVKMAYDFLKLQCSLHNKENHFTGLSMICPRCETKNLKIELDYIGTDEIFLGRGIDHYESFYGCGCCGYKFRQNWVDINGEIIKEPLKEVEE